MIELHCGDSVEVMRTMADNSVDSIVTDPPYGLSDHRPADVVACLTAWLAGEEFKPKKRGFMGRAWDGWVPGPEVFREALRVAKPGAHMLVFAGTRSMDLMMMAVRLAGWEIRDSIGHAHEGGDSTQPGLMAWSYGSGFPKNFNVAKAITNRASPELVREIKLWLIDWFERSGKSKAQINRECGFTASDYLQTEKGNDAGGRRTWHLLLPYGEKWIRLKEAVGFDDRYDADIARLGVVAGRIKQAAATGEVFGDYAGEVTEFHLTEEAQKWKGWGTALKPAWEPIIIARKPLNGTVAENVLKYGTGAYNIDACRIETDEDLNGGAYAETGGRKVSDSLHAGSGMNQAGKTAGREYVQPTGRWPANVVHDGSAEVLAAFPAEAGQQAPIKGTEASVPAKGDVAYGFRDRVAFTGHGDAGSAARFFYCAKTSSADRHEGLDDKQGNGNSHPTVKPTGLMRYLVRLVTPPGGTVLDFCMGSGSTGKAADIEGFNFIGIDADPHCVAVADRRIGADAPLFRDAA